MAAIPQWLRVILPVAVFLLSTFRALGNAPLPDFLRSSAPLRETNHSATRSYAYDYDTAGNVIQAGRVNAAGQGRDSFTADDFNFHVVRTWSAVDLVGEAATNATVTANGIPATRDGTRFVVSLPLASTASVATVLIGAVVPTGSNTENVASKSATTALRPYYPANQGFLGETTREFLYAGQQIDRYGGSASSRFFSPAGTAAGARALPPGTASQTLRTFEVVKPFQVETGTVAPYFGEIGYGTQYRTPITLDILLNRGILREVTP